MNIMTKNKNKKRSMKIGKKMHKDCSREKLVVLDLSKRNRKYHSKFI